MRGGGKWQERLGDRNEKEGGVVSARGGGRSGI